jgi:hypothetical protein
MAAIIILRRGLNNRYIYPENVFYRFKDRLALDAHDLRKGSGII